MVPYVVIDVTMDEVCGGAGQFWGDVGGGALVSQKSYAVPRYSALLNPG